MSESTHDTPLSQRRLRTWIRLLRLTRSTENHLREFLRVNYDTTLPRFDVAAALHREAAPMKMSELSEPAFAGVERQRHRRGRPAGAGRAM